MLKRFVNLGSLYFTCITAPLLLISLAVQSDKILSPDRFLLILVFSFVASLGTAIKEHPEVGRGFGYTVHALCYLGGFLGFILLPSALKFTGTVIIFLIYCALYIAVCVIRASRKTKQAKPSSDSAKRSSDEPSEQKQKKAPKRKKETEYKSLFSGDGQDR